MTPDQPSPPATRDIHAAVFNALSRALAEGNCFVPLSVREQPTTAIELEIELGIRADERARIAAVINPDLVDAVARWFDEDDRLKMYLYSRRPDFFPTAWKERSDQLQQDLRRWARLLRGESGDDADAH